MEAKIEELNREYQADIRLLVTPAVSTASHELRRRVKEGGSIAQDVPEAVNAYILDHHLYWDSQDPSELSDSAEGR